MTLTKQLPSWKPRSYQEIGVQLMIKQACAGLLWKPGRGKTSVVYAAFRILQESGFAKRWLIICPIRPAYNVWPEQCHTYTDFDGLRVCVLHGKDKEEKLHDENYDLYIINPEGLPWLFGGDVPKPERARLVRDMFDGLVVDESTKFANPQTKRFKLLRTAVKYFRRRYILTGSPRPKSLMDLFGQVYILDEGASLGRYITHFRSKFFYSTGFGGYDWKPFPGAQEEIIEKVSPLVHVMDDEQGLDLPELLINDIWVDMPPAAVKLYRQMEQEMLATVESGQVVAANAAVASSKCRQIANGILLHTKEGEYTPVHDAKIEALKDLMEQLGGEPLLITYEFVADRARITEELKVPSISTGNPNHDNDYIRKFSKGELVAVQGHPQSISLGIDGLQHACSDIAMVGVTWSLLNYEQVINRVRRSGSKAKTVTLHRILARGTVDEKVVQVLDSRERDQDSFLAMLRNMANSQHLLSK